LACGEMPSAEGRFILTILFILSNYFSKIRIHSFSFSIKLAAFQASVSAEHRHPWPRPGFIGMWEIRHLWDLLQ
jgi:hypothetical protein